MVGDCNESKTTSWDLDTDGKNGYEGCREIFEVIRLLDLKLSSVLLIHELVDKIYLVKIIFKKCNIPAAPTPVVAILNIESDGRLCCHFRVCFTRSHSQKLSIQSKILTK